MPLTIIAGRAGSGKSAVIYDRINELGKAGTKAVLIVPEQFTLQAERELIESGNGRGFMTVNVMSMTRLMSDVMSSVRAPRKTLIDERGKAAALSSVALQIQDELQVFGRAASFSGFASEAAEIISEFKKHGITPEKINKTVSETNLSSQKIADIGAIYAAFEAFLSDRDYIDSDDMLNLLAQILPEAEQYSDTHFFMDGFDMLTAQDLSIARALLQLSGHLSVCINYAKDSDEGIFYSGKRTLDDLSDLAHTTGHQLDVRYAHKPHVSKHPSINHLESNLFAAQPDMYKGECAIKINKATTTQEEAESIACEILNLIKSDPDLRFSDISILCCGGLNTYAPLFERMFTRYEIPCFTHRRKSIAEHPAVSYILSAISAKIYNMPRSETLAMIKSGYAGISYEDAIEFEDYVLDCAIDGYLFTRAFKRSAKKYDLEKLNILRENLLAPLEGLSAKTLPAKVHLKSIFNLMAAAHIKDTLEFERDELSDSGAHAYAALASQVYNSIIAILEQLNVLFEDREMSLEQVLFALEESFISTQIGILPVSSDEVLIGELGRSKLAETRYLFVAGAAEGSLPPNASQSPILSDWDIAALSDAGIDFMKTDKARRSIDDYAIYQAFSLPSRALFISYSENGADGVKLPSIIVTRIEDIFGIPVEKATIDYTVSKAAALSAAAKAFGALGDGRIAPPGWKQAVSALIHSDKSNAELDKMRLFLSAPTQVPEIAPQKDGVIISSVSQIEQYAGCPFSYMVQYSLQPAEDPGEDMTPAGEGAFLHEAMERLGIKLSEYDMDAMDEEQIQTIMQREAEIIAENFDFQRLSRDNKGKYQASQLIKTARHGALIYSKHLRNSKFTPLGQEIEFGEGKPLGPIEFTLKSGTQVKISGKVDRLDTYFCANGEYARIVDYKSSVKKVDYPQIESGRQLQLFIYMDAYLSRNPNIKASGVFYFPMRKDYIDQEKGAKRNDKMQGLFVDTPENVDALDHDIIELGASELIKAKIKKDGGFDKNSDNITAEGFHKVMNYAKGRAKETLDDMDAGEIPVRPVTHGNSSQCTYCDFASICKKDINMHEERPELTGEAAKEIILGGNDG